MALIQNYLDEDVLQELDALSRLTGMNRGMVIRLAVKLLRQQSSDQILRTLNEVYGGDRDPAENRLLQGIKAKFRRTLRDEPWPDESARAVKDKRPKKGRSE